MTAVRSAGSAGSALPALTDADVADLRAQLKSGATPRVRLRAGGTGAVIDVGNPDADGAEYIKVKVTLNGTRDTLPFAPDDLAATPRRVPPAAANASRAASTATATPPSSPPAAAPSPTAKAGRRPRRSPPPRTAPDVSITLRTGVSAEAVQSRRRQPARRQTGRRSRRRSRCPPGRRGRQSRTATGRADRGRSPPRQLHPRQPRHSPADHVGSRTAGFRVPNVEGMSHEDAQR